MSLRSPRSQRRRAAGQLARATLALSTLVGVFALPTAHAAPLVQAATAREHRIERALQRFETLQGMHADQVARKIARSNHGLAASSSPRMFDPSRWLWMHHHVRDTVSDLRAHLSHQKRATLDRLESLRAERARITQWLAEWGILQTCPVEGPNVVVNNFGVIVDLPNVPVHIHMGNDIMASAGTPIVAPFQGEASASTSALGGLEVRVAGAQGYVYNAHLSGYGRLGHVQAGDVIGYVGNTGDATGPHDHFEWHPGNGVAVDPNPLLSVVC